MTAPEGLRRVLNFLGLPDGEKVPPVRFDPCPPVNRALWTQLSRHFAPHNERLFHLLGEQWDWDGRSIQKS